MDSILSIIGSQVSIEEEVFISSPPQKCGDSRPVICSTDQEHDFCQQDNERCDEGDIELIGHDCSHFLHASCSSGSGPTPGMSRCRKLERSGRWRQSAPLLGVRFFFRFTPDEWNDSLQRANLLQLRCDVLLKLRIKHANIVLMNMGKERVANDIINPNFPKLPLLIRYPTLLPDNIDPLK